MDRQANCPKVSLGGAAVTWTVNVPANLATVTTTVPTMTAASYTLPASVQHGVQPFAEPQADGYAEPEDWQARALRAESKIAAAIQAVSEYDRCGCILGFGFECPRCLALRILRG